MSELIKEKETYIDEINLIKVDKTIESRDVDLLIAVINKLIEDYNYKSRECEILLNQIKGKNK